MRLLLPFAPLVCLALPLSANAQEFDLYQAALDHLALDAVQPSLEAAYPGLVDMAANIDPALAEAGIALLYHNSPKTPSVFLFCKGQLSGFTAVLSPQDASKIILRQTVPEFPPTETYASAEGVTIRFPEADIAVQYWGIGTPESFVVVNYPIMTFTTMKFAARCEDLAAGR